MKLGLGLVLVLIAIVVLRVSLDDSLWIELLNLSSREEINCDQWSRFRMERYLVGEAQDKIVQCEQHEKH